MPAWFTIAIILIFGLTLLNPRKQDFDWFKRLRRPRWVFFEPWFPLIWLLIYAGFYGSAVMAWNRSGRIDLMVGFGLLMVLAQGHTWVPATTRSLPLGTFVNVLGWFWALALASLVGIESHQAALLLMPYLIWAPLMILMSWRMEQLNS